MAQKVVRRTPHQGFNLLISSIFIASSGPLALCQTSAAPHEVPAPVTAASPERTPAYDVTTIKPPGPNDYAMPLRQYIQVAFGLPGNSTGLVFGPDWINSAKYVIRGKPPDSIREAMKAMTPAERGKEEQMMMQALLADRFKLKAHFETKEMQLYELRVAKGGSKLKENPDTSKGRAAVGASRIRGTAVPIHAFLGLLESVPDIGGRVILDKTELSGTYDIDLKWEPLQAAAPTGAVSGSSPSSDSEDPSLVIAIEEQLGLKLVPTKAPGQVVVIDHIERPSEN